MTDIITFVKPPKNSPCQRKTFIKIHRQLNSSQRHVIKLQLRFSKLKHIGEIHIGRRHIVKVFYSEMIVSNFENNFRYAEAINLWWLEAIKVWFPLLHNTFSHPKTYFLRCLHLYRNAWNIFVVSKLLPLYIKNTWQVLTVRKGAIIHVHTWMLLLRQ